jgi:hypothetical protein
LTVKSIPIDVSPAYRDPLNEKATGGVDRLFWCPGQTGVDFDVVEKTEGGLAAGTLNCTTYGLKRVLRVTLEVKVVMALNVHESAGQVILKTSVGIVDALADYMHAVNLHRTEFHRSVTVVPGFCSEDQLSAAVAIRDEGQISRWKGLQIRQQRHLGKTVRLSEEHAYDHPAEDDKRTKHGVMHRKIS